MAEGPDSGGKRIEIRKYPNRRYYDTTHSRHLTLDEIRCLVQQGHDIRVTDSKSSSDITGQVLTQIILELETPKLDSFPVPLLVRLIRVNDQLVKDFIEKYFHQALNSFLNYQQQVEEQIRQVHGLPIYPPVSAWTKAMLQPFTSAFTGEKSKTGSSATSSPAEGAPPADPGELRSLIKELQSQIAQMKQARPPRKPRARAKRSKG